MRKPVASKPALRLLFPAAMLAAAALLWLGDRSAGARAADATLYSLKEMALVIPPIFVILGLLEVWVPRETMIRFIGPGSGVRGVVLAFLLGSAAAGPLYGAFPVAQLLLRKGASFRNALVLVGAWSTTKIPLVLFEASSMGVRFAMTRLVVDIAGIAVLSWLLDRFMSDADRREILAKAG